MKKIFDYRLVWFCATIGTVSLLSSAVKAQFVPASSANQQYAPYAHPVAMQNVGTQQYIGGQTVLQGVQRDSVTGNVTPTVQVAPTINSVYATPMRRVNEIPLYGKNKNLYFYAEKKPDESVFHDSGLYVFAAYSTGKNKNGINAEKSIYDDADNWFGGSDANSDMGTANGLTLGVGRQMSDSLGVEFMYSRYTGMKYGDYVHFSEEEDTGETDDDDEPIMQTVVNDSTYEVIDGGDVSSSFVGVGLRYNLDRYFGVWGGRIKPYLALSVGIVDNNIKNYTITDPDGSSDGDVAPDEWEAPAEGEAEDGEPTTLADYVNQFVSYNSPDNPVEYTEKSDGELTFVGKSTRHFGYAAELGLSLALEGDLYVELFYRYNRYGSVETSGNILTAYTETSYDWYVPTVEGGAWNMLNADQLATLCSSGYSAVQVDAASDPGLVAAVCVSDSDEGDVQAIVTRQKEKGDMNFFQYGIKLRYMF